VRAVRRIGFRGKRVFFVVAIAVFALDWVTKAWAFAAVARDGVPSKLHGGQPAIEIVPGFFYLVDAWNPGGIWGIAQTGLASQLLVVFRAIAAPALVVLAGLTPVSERRVLWAYALFCAGALGNLYDNVVYSERGVRDFLDFFLVGPNGYHYPTFNIADASIVCAAGLILLDLVRPRAGAKPSPPA